jgi:hypothetical protein
MAEPVKTTENKVIVLREGEPVENPPITLQKGFVAEVHSEYVIVFADGDIKRVRINGGRSYEIGDTIVFYEYPKERKDRGLGRIFRYVTEFFKRMRGVQNGKGNHQ